MRSYWVRVGPQSSVTRVLLKGRNLEEDTHTHTHTHTHRHGGGCVKIKAEAGMMLVEAKKRQRWPAHHLQPGERLGADSVSHLSKRNQTI